MKQSSEVVNAAQVIENATWGSMIIKDWLAARAIRLHLAKKKRMKMKQIQISFDESLISQPQYSDPFESTDEMECEICEEETYERDNSNIINYFYDQKCRLRCKLQVYDYFLNIGEKKSRTTKTYQRVNHL